MTTSTKWRLHFTDNATTAADGVGVLDVQMRTAIGVDRPFVPASVSATATYTGTAVIGGTSGLTALTISNVDDSILPISLPFPISFGGTTTSTVWVSTNSYVVFTDPGGVDVHELFSGKVPARPSLQIGANDGRATSIYYGSLDSNVTFRICFTGNSHYNNTGTVEVWELKFTAATPDAIRLDCGSGPSFGGRGIGDGSNATYVTELASGVNDAGYDIVTSGTPAEAVATASSVRAPLGPHIFSAAGAIDGLDATDWYSVEGESTVDEWLQVEFTSSFTCVEYVLTIKAYDAGTPFTAIRPTEWTLEAWDGASWDVVDTRTGVDMTSVGSDADWVFTLDFDTYAAITFPELTLDATTLFDGALFPNLTLSGTLVQTLVIHSSSVIEGDSFFPELQLEGALNPALALPELLLDASGIAGNIGAGNITLPKHTAQGGFADGVTFPLWTLDASGIAATLIEGDVGLPELTLSGSLEAALPLPTWALDGILLSGTDSAGQLTLPNLVVNGDFGPMADLTWPDWELNATGSSGLVAVGNLILPAWQVAGTSYQDTISTGAVTFALLSVSGAIVSEALITADLTLPALALSANGLAGTLSTATLTLPLLALDGDGYFDNIGTADIVLTVWQLQGTLYSTQAPSVVVAVPTLALNTAVRAVSLYDGLAANSYATFAGMTLAATAQGIVALTGDTDQGEPIAASIASGVTDLDGETLKRVLCGYVGYRASGDMMLTLISDDHHEFAYALEPRQDAAVLHPTRVKFGRGVTGRYLQWRLENDLGAAFSIDSLTLDIDPLKRRV